MPRSPAAVPLNCAADRHGSDRTGLWRAPLRRSGPERQGERQRTADCGEGRRWRAGTNWENGGDRRDGEDGGRNKWGSVERRSGSNVVERGTGTVGVGGKTTEDLEDDRGKRVYSEWRRMWEMQGTTELKTT